MIRILSTLLIFAATVGTAQESEPTQITPFATVVFPDATESSIVDGMTITGSWLETDAHFSTVRDLSGMGFDLSDKEEFYEGALYGKKNFPTTKQITSERIEVDGIEAIQMNIIGQSSSGVNFQETHMAIIIGEHLVCMTSQLYEPVIEAAVARQDAFFNSLEIDQNVISAAQDTSDSNAAFRAGERMGKLLFFLVPIGILVGIVFLIYKLVQRARRSS